MSSALRRGVSAVFLVVPGQRPQRFRAQGGQVQRAGQHFHFLLDRAQIRIVRLVEQHFQVVAQRAGIVRATASTRPWAA